MNPVALAAREPADLLLLIAACLSSVARGQKQDEGAALVVADGVELGVAAASGAADTMSQGPHFAAPAQRWTWMQELSMNSRSGASSSPARIPLMGPDP